MKVHPTEEGLEHDCHFHEHTLCKDPGPTLQCFLKVNDDLSYY